MKRVPTLPAPTHDEQKEESSKMRDEYMESKKMSKGKGRKLMKAALKEEKESASHEYEVDERTRMRQRILSMSLFPNLYNKGFLLRAQGPN